MTPDPKCGSFSLKMVAVASSIRKREKGASFNGIDLKRVEGGKGGSESARLIKARGAR
jgi:hypothetical protein